MRPGEVGVEAEGGEDAAHMVEVLEPLEVGDGDTSSVDVEVRDDQGTVLLEISRSMCRSKSRSRSRSRRRRSRITCSILSPAGVIGPLAASPMILALILLALPLWMTWEGW